MSTARLSVAFAVVLAGLAVSTEARAGIWGIRSTAGPAPRGSTAPVELFSINEDGSGYVDYGNIFNNSTGVNTYTDFDALAVSPHYGLMAFEFFGSGSASRLSTVNPLGDGAHDVTAVKVNLALSGREIRGAAFDLKDRLWAIDTANDEIFQVDPTTGGMKGTAVGLTLGGSPFSLSGNTVDLAVRRDGSFFMTAVNGGVAKVYSLNETTGALAELHANGSWLGEVGATFSKPAGLNDLFAVDVSGLEDFVRYDLTGPITRTALFTLPGTLSAGRGDLAGLLQTQPVFRHFGDADPYIDEGWSRRVAGTNVSAGPVPAENAWRVADESSAGSNAYNYFKAMTDGELQAAWDQGWVLQMELRVEGVSDAVGGAVGAQVAFPGPIDQIFSFGFGTDAAGNPIAGVHNGATFLQSAPIAGDGYHFYEMIFDPDTQTVDVFADGVEILSDYAGTNHTAGINRVLFGANSSADQGTGYYRLVNFHVVPEPSAFLMLGLGALGLLFSRRRRRRPQS